MKAVYGTDPKAQGFFWIESEQKRTEAWTVRRGSPADFEAVYQGRPGQRAGVIFLEDDLRAHYKPPLGLILGPTQPAVAAFLANGHMRLQSWDTAFSTTSQSAYTVCVTAMLIACNEYHCGESAEDQGPCDSHFDVYILDVFRKRMDFAELIPAIRIQANTWRPQEIVIEKKASGIDAIASLASSGLPIVPVTPRDSKKARALNTVGIKSAGSVQGWFRQHRVLTPNPDQENGGFFIPWFENWKSELRDFSGDDDTSSDQVDATVHLVTRAIILSSGAVILPSGWCYSEDTEVLTKSGWKRFEQVDIKNDLFATRSHLKEFEWQKATAINVTDYSGDMISIKAQCIDCLVTPEHRALVNMTWWRPDGGYEEFLAAESLLNKNYGWPKIPVTSKWIGTSIKNKTFTCSDVRAKTIEMSGDQFCAFMGMWLSEGFLCNRAVGIAQRRTSKGYLGFYNLIKDITGKAEPSYSDGTFYIGCKPLRDYLKQFGIAKNKYIPDEIMDASPEQIDVFLRFFILGDGNKEGRTIYTSSKRLADQLQELLQKAGKSAIIGVDDRRGRSILLHGREFVTKNINYRIHISTDKEKKIRSSKEFYEGKIGCVSVPNGTLYVRRNGRPAWSGNSPERSILPSMAGDPLSSIGQQPEPDQDPRAIFLTSLGNLPNSSENPFFGMCGSCSSFKQSRCQSNVSPYHTKKLTPFNSCGQYSAPGNSFQSDPSQVLPNGILRL